MNVKELCCAITVALPGGLGEAPDSIAPPMALPWRYRAVTLGSLSPVPAHGRARM
jgi:hypothetical protein